MLIEKDQQNNKAISGLNSIKNTIIFLIWNSKQYIQSTCSIYIESLRRDFNDFCEKCQLNLLFIFIWYCLDVSKRIYIGL